MHKVLMRYTGDDDNVSGLKCGQLLEVETHLEGSRIYYTWVNKFHEEMYIYPDEVIPYE